MRGPAFHRFLLAILLAQDFAYLDKIRPDPSEPPDKEAPNPRINLAVNLEKSRAGSSARVGTCHWRVEQVPWDT